MQRLDNLWLPQIMSYILVKTWLHSASPLPRLHLCGGAFPPSRCLQALDVHFAEANGRASSKTTGIMAKESLQISVMQICRDPVHSLGLNGFDLLKELKVSSQQLVNFGAVFALVSQAAIFAETHASELWHHVSQKGSDDPMTRWPFVGEPWEKLKTSVETSRDTLENVWENHEKRIEKQMKYFCRKRLAFGYLSCSILVNQMALQRMWRMELWILLKDKKSWHPWVLDVSWLDWTQNLYRSQLFWLCHVLLRDSFSCEYNVKASFCQQPTDFVAWIVQL